MMAVLIGPSLIDFAIRFALDLKDTAVHKVGSNAIRLIWLLGLLLSVICGFVTALVAFPVNIANEALSHFVYRAYEVSYRLIVLSTLIGASTAVTIMLIGLYVRRHTARGRSQFRLLLLVVCLILLPVLITRGLSLLGRTISSGWVVGLDIRPAKLLAAVGILYVVIRYQTTGSSNRILLGVLTVASSMLFVNLLVFCYIAAAPCHFNNDRGLKWAMRHRSLRLP
ncbi:MAG: hypothetical protein HC853_12545 [Anaerolineae bacterium]|nr:hypothetical protein [Anaerolineae bacterium]